jgi:16S rRNA (uracil1498-N3)-methyltransferase
MAHLESFYVPAENVRGNRVVFPEEEVHHLFKVLRKRAGDRVSATDGRGNFYEIRLVYLDREKAEGEILKKRRLIGEPAITITLAVGMIKPQRLDWLVEKATELGVRRMVFFPSRYSTVTGSAQKVERWQRIAIAALKQAGRSILPEIRWHDSLQMALDELERPVLYGDADSDHTVGTRIAELRQDVYDLYRVTLLVGPEGGFSTDERALFEERGFLSVSLGERRLRTETAAIALTTLALQAFGEC